MTEENEIKTIIDLLSSLETFKGLRIKDLEDIARAGAIVHLKDDEILFNEGDEASSLYIIMNGAISVLKSGREIVKLSEGEMLGELAVLDHGTRSATAKSYKKTSLFEIKENTFQSILGHKEITLRNILDMLTYRLRESDKKLAIDHTIMTTLIHDINNLLSSFSAASLIEHLSTDPKVKSLSKMIVESQMALSQMIQGALKMYRENQISSVRNDTDVLKTIDKAINHYLREHPDVKKMLIQYEKPFDNINVKHNANDIIRVLTNLIINAAQASKEGSSITIKVNFDEKNVTIAIIDQGQGIPIELHSKIFKPGFTSKETGNGLGLFSCKTIVEQLHEGQLTLESEEGKGANFTISLPL